MNRLAIPLGAAIAAAMLPPPLPAQVYRCVSEGGRVEYSDAAIKGSDCMQQVGSHPPAPTPGPPASPKSATTPLTDYVKKLDEQRAKDQKEATKVQEAAALQEQRCKQARTRLAAFTQGGRIFEYDEAGERRFLGDEEIAQKRAAAEASVARECS